MACLALSVKEFSSEVPHFFKYTIKKSNCVGEGAATAELSIVHAPKHEQRSLAGIPEPDRTGVSRVGARIGCEDGFVLGDFSLTCD